MTLLIAGTACDSLDEASADAGSPPAEVAGDGADRTGGDSTSRGPRHPDAAVMGSFSTMHAKEIELDCMQTIQCSAQQGLELPSDPLASCQRDSAERLDGTPSLQDRFLTLIERCAAFVVCDYVNCAQGRR